MRHVLTSKFGSKRHCFPLHNPSILAKAYQESNALSCWQPAREQINPKVRTKKQSLNNRCTECANEMSAQRTVDRRTLWPAMCTIKRLKFTICLAWFLPEALRLL